MSRRAIDLVGRLFGRITVVAREGSRPSSEPGSTYSTWRCTCSCGGSAVATRTALIQGHTVSCGCLRGPAKRLQAIAKLIAAWRDVELDEGAPSARRTLLAIADLVGS